MDLFSKKIIKNLLKRYEMRPSKGLGQHFLIDKGVVKNMVLAAGLEPGDVVLEIGPGLGTLTQALAGRVQKVVAVEKDPKMAEILRETMKGFKNVEIIQEDVLKADLSSLVSKCPKFKVAANLPFYLTAPVIRKLLENKKQPELMALIVQKEVAQRIAAKPPKMSILAVSVQFYAKAEIVRYISKKSFWPRPKVDSALIIISPQAENILDSGLFFKIVRAGFSQPRKQIGNNLSKKLRLNKEDVKSWLLKNRIDPGRRAETLYIKDWLNLTKTYKA